MRQPKIISKRTSDKCFICLDDTRNRVCHQCTCHAHPQCWTKYLRKTLEIYMMGYDDSLIFLYPYAIECPICKCSNKQMLPQTRSTERIFNMEIFITTLKRILVYQKQIENRDDKKEEIFTFYHIMFNSIIANKHLIKKKKSLDAIITDILTYCYYNDHWLGAKEVYYAIFQQIFPTRVEFNKTKKNNINVYIEYLDYLKILKQYN